MTEFLEQKKQICLMMSDLSDLDVTVIDKNNEIFLRYAVFILPEFISHVIQSSFKIINQHLQHQSVQNVFYFMDAFHLNYMSLGLWNEGEYVGAIINGPYLTSTPDDAFMNNIMKKNKLAYTMKPQLANVYKGLIILNSKKLNSLGRLLVTLDKVPAIEGMEQFNTTDIMSEESRLTEERDVHEFIDQYQLIGDRYVKENNLLEAVKNGNEEACADILARQTLYSQPQYRIPNDPLRSVKNLSLGFNSILRKYAEMGGVHPYYLDEMSARYSVELERSNRLSEIGEIGKEMILDYCRLVNKYSTNQYSPLIKDAINLIETNYTSQIGMAEAAELLHVSPAHFARQFKKETGYSFTQFITDKRIRKAKFLLEHSQESITDIAMMLGFSDVNYFSRIFKKNVGVTPNHFRKNI